MFPVNETENKPKSTEKTKPKRFESIHQFAKWIDAELEELTNKHADFTTGKSIGKYFQRS